MFAALKTKKPPEFPLTAFFEIRRPRRDRNPLFSIGGYALRVVILTLLCFVLPDAWKQQKHAAP